RLIPVAGIPSQWPPTMGQQSNKIIKRRRRADYLKRKKEQAKLGGIVKKTVVKKEASAKKEPAKKAATKKVATKKAPAKKVAKKADPKSGE
ncbi:MAG: Histone H1-like nucleoprotein, partial [Verrucomicrobiota bacterium]